MVDVVYAVGDDLVSGVDVVVDGVVVLVDALFHLLERGTAVADGGVTDGTLWNKQINYYIIEIPN